MQCSVRPSFMILCLSVCLFENVMAFYHVCPFFCHVCLFFLSCLSVFSVMSVSLDMLNNFCYHGYAQKSLSLDMLINFCFHAYAHKLLFMGKNGHGFFDILIIITHVNDV